MDFDVTSMYGRRADRRWNRMSVGDILERVTWSAPDKPAIIGWDGAYGSPRFAQVTYAEADATANQVANALLAEGLQRGERVLLYCDNSVEAILLMIGIAKAGLVCVPVNPNLAPDLLAWTWRRVEAKFAVADGQYAATAADVLADGPGLGAVIPIGGGYEQVPDVETWIAGHPASEPEVSIPIHADDIWSLVFTSGTTAMPKASMASHVYSYLSAWPYAMSLTRGLEVETDLVMCTFLPIIYHCGHNSVPFPTFLTGGTFVLGRRPDPAGLAAAITAHRVTAVWAGSPMWVQKLTDAAGQNAAQVDLSSLTVAMFSWGAMRPSMAADLDRAAGHHVRLLEVFGQTESMSCYRFWPDKQPEKFAQSLDGVNYVGVPNPLLAADIVDVDGASLRADPGTPGEAVYRSPAITAGYFADPELTAEAFRGGWFHSGDSCAYDADGVQIMVDRFKDIVKSGGENISSLRVESAIAECPGVQRVAVVGVEDSRWGEAVTAAVIRAEGATLTAEDVLAHARERLSRFEVPKRVVFVDHLPETVGGKIRKFELRRLLRSAD